MCPIHRSEGDAAALSSWDRLGADGRTGLSSLAWSHKDKRVAVIAEGLTAAWEMFSGRIEAS